VGLNPDMISLVGKGLRRKRVGQLNLFEVVETLLFTYLLVG
jgi:hypothetical protein